MCVFDVHYRQSVCVCCTFESINQMQKLKVYLPTVRVGPVNTEHGTIMFMSVTRIPIRTLFLSDSIRNQSNLLAVQTPPSIPSESRFVRLLGANFLFITLCAPSSNFTLFAAHIHLCGISHVTQWAGFSGKWSGIFDFPIWYNSFFAETRGIVSHSLIHYRN